MLARMIPRAHAAADGSTNATRPAADTNRLIRFLSHANAHHAAIVYAIPTTNAGTVHSAEIVPYCLASSSSQPPVMIGPPRVLPPFALAEARRAAPEQHQLVIVEPEALGCQVAEVPRTTLHLKDLPARIAVEVVVVPLPRQFIARRLPRNL